MGGFGTKEQENQNTNWQQGAQSAESQGWSNSYNQSVQGSSNQANQQATSATTLYGGQAPFLQSLWGQANALSGADPGVAAQARNAWGGALGAGINPGVADVIANASADMGLDFQRNVLPGIRRGSVGTGSLGGSRQGIAEGLAAGEVARAQQNMATQLYTGALDQASRERTAALSMSGQMQALPWQGLESYARVLGGPVMQSYGQSTGASSGGGYGSSYGTAASGQTSGSRGYAMGGGQGTGSSEEFDMNILGKK